MLVNIYQALIGSVIDYAAFTYPTLSKSLAKDLQIIQNKAMRIIFKQPYDCTTESLKNLSGLQLVADRLNDLTINYFRTAIVNNNPLIMRLVSEYDSQFISINMFNSNNSDCHKTL